MYQCMFVEVLPFFLLGYVQVIELVEYVGQNSL